MKLIKCFSKYCEYIRNRNNVKITFSYYKELYLKKYNHSNKGNNKIIEL